LAVPLVDAATIVNECDTSGAMVEPNQVDSRLVLTFRAEAAVLPNPKMLWGCRRR
jgi:hypothetical protein